MFSQIDLILKPSWLSCALFALPCMLALVVTHELAIADHWQLLISVLMIASTCWLCVSTALLKAPGSAKRITLHNDHARIESRGGKHWRADLCKGSLHFSGLFVLVLREQEGLLSHHTKRQVVLLHRFNLANGSDARRLAVWFNFSRLPHVSV